MYRSSKLAFGWLIALGLLLQLSACSSSRSAANRQYQKLAELNRDEYVLLDKAEATAKSHRVWVLFIPIGGSSDERLMEKAENTAIDMVPTADGIVEPRFEYKKIRIPLILLTYVYKRADVTGYTYRMKTEAEMEEMRKAKQSE